MLHFVHRWGPIDLNSYQTCTICGKTRSAGEPHCNHSWQEMPDGRLKCIHCGDFKLSACRHEFERKDGHFVCMKCGETKYDPSQECIHHDWEIMDQCRYANKCYVIQKCKHCGTLKETNLTGRNYW